MKDHSYILSMFVVALGATFMPGCAVTPHSGDGDHSAGVPLGSFTLLGPTFGQQALVPTACVSGEPQFFLGFDLRDDRAGLVTRLVVDPVTGPIARLFSASAPFEKTVLFNRSDCRVFRFSLNSTGWRVDRVDQLNVSVELDCHLPSGESIVGKAADPGCL
jgi:hypothetical protein